MNKLLTMAAALAIALPAVAFAQAQSAPNDAEIAHIAYTAGQIDIAAGKQALEKSKSPVVRDFAELMVRDHTAVNDQALALVKKLGVTPQANAISESLSKDAAAKLASYEKLEGAAFDKVYLENEVAYHRTVNGALRMTLIPSAKNPELKALLQTGLNLFEAHQQHAEHMSQQVK
jgi:putative membrane protein